MPYSIHFVPMRSSSEVLLSLGRCDGLGQPINQRTWPNCVRMLEAIGPYLAEQQVRSAKASLLAGRAHWLPEVSLSDRDIDRLGL